MIPVKQFFFVEKIANFIDTNKTKKKQLNYKQNKSEKN